MNSLFIYIVGYKQLKSNRLYIIPRCEDYISLFNNRHPYPDMDIYSRTGAEYIYFMDTGEYLKWDKERECYLFDFDEGF